MESQIDNRYDDEPPLDPAVERVRRKLARLMIVSIGIMVLGLIAVFAVIVYKVAIDRPSPGAVRDITDISHLVPDGAAILESDIGQGEDGLVVLVRIQLADGSQQMVLLDAASGDVIGKFLVDGTEK